MTRDEDVLCRPCNTNVESVPSGMTVVGGRARRDCFTGIDFIDVIAPNDVNNCPRWRSSKPEAGRSTSMNALTAMTLKTVTDLVGLESAEGVSTSPVMPSLGVRGSRPSLTYHDGAQPTCITFIAVFRGSDTKDCGTRGDHRSLPQRRGWAGGKDGSDSNRGNRCFESKEGIEWNAVNAFAEGQLGGATAPNTNRSGQCQQRLL
jgi:hypothetical protein